MDASLDRQSFEEAISRAGPVSWATDVDTHYASFVRDWVAAGKSVIPCRRQQRPCQTFLSQASLALQGAEAELARRQTRQTHGWTRAACGTIARLWQAFNHACQQARQAVRADRCAYLQGLVDAVSSSDLRDPRHLFNAVRRAFPKAVPARKSKLLSSPAVELEDGTLAATGPAERAARWRAHFAAQELGQDVTPSAYSRLAAGTITTARPSFDWALVPTLAEVEQAVLRLKRGKASGHDGITSELLKLKATSSAKHFLPIFTKSLLALREPVKEAPFSCSQSVLQLPSPVTGTEVS